MHSHAWPGAGQRCETLVTASAPAPPWLTRHDTTTTTTTSSAITTVAAVAAADTLPSDGLSYPSITSRPVIPHTRSVSPASASSCPAKATSGYVSPTLPFVFLRDSSTDRRPRLPATMKTTRLSPHMSPPSGRLRRHPRPSVPAHLHLQTAHRDGSWPTTR